MSRWKELCERREAIDSPEWMSSPYLLMRPVEFDKIRAVVEAAQLVAEHASEPDVAGRMVIKSVRVANMEQALKDLGVTNEAE